MRDKCDYMAFRMIPKSGPKSVVVGINCVELPAASRWKGQALTGRLIYKDETEKYVPSSAINSKFKEGLSDPIRRAVSNDPARRVPSPS